MMNFMQIRFLVSILIICTFLVQAARAQGSACLPNVMERLAPGGCFLDDPTTLNLFLDSADRDMQRSHALIKYHAAVADVAALVEASNEYDAKAYILTQILWARAIRDAVRDNFFSLQEYMKATNSGLDVTIRPYTDGTMEIFFNGTLHSRQQTEHVLRHIALTNAPDRNWKASISPNEIDRDWAWDQFRDGFGNRVWRCRGKHSGQFLEDFFCNGHLQRDYTWPGD
jgi:hypothetical protein